ALQTKADVPGLEDALVTCLERVFKTKYGASLLPHFMPFVVIGLGADSQKVRGLACKTVGTLVYFLSENYEEAPQLVREYNVYPLLLNCLTDGDEQVATASMDAIKRLASTSEGMEIVFPADVNEPRHLGNLAARCSSLGRVRVLALIVKLFSISSSVASVIYRTNLLTLLEADVRNANDTLMTLSVLELLYELAEVQHSTEFLSRTSLLQLLGSIICIYHLFLLNSREVIYGCTNLALSLGVKTVISAIDERLGVLESPDPDECECALEALGQIGSSIQGATLLLLSGPPAARRVVHAAFNWQGRGKQLAALHALGNICGGTRSDNTKMLNSGAEESLRRLIYETASKTSKLTPSGLFLSVLQEVSEIRLAGYRLITGLAARSWCLMEICSRQEIIDIVTDTYTETTKIGMEARHNCCQAIYKAFMSSSKLIGDPALAVVAEKLQEAFKKGPYLGRKQHREAQPAVMTAERF
ncbi:hypothetical protein RJ640_004423, partial [Escallonia rubra]